MNRVAPKLPARRAPTSRPPAARNVAARVSQPSEALQKFRKVLELELRRGCDDGAVMGGIDRFLANARVDKQVSAVLSASPRLPEGYHGLSAPNRRAWIQKVVATSPSAAAKTGPASTDPGAPEVRGAESAATGRKTTTAKKAPLAPAPAPRSNDPLDQPVTAIKGVKVGLQARLARLDVHTVRDLLYLFPNRHNDFANIRPISELRVDEEQTAVVNVWSARVVRLGYRPGTEATVGDESGTMRVVWFNQPYLAEQLKTNDRIVLSGKVGLYQRLRTMENPEWERWGEDDLTHTGRLVPVYPSTQGLSQRVLRRMAKEAVDRFAPAVPDPLPADMRKRHGLPTLPQALRQMHYPDSLDTHELARKRVAFEELLCVQLAVLEKRLAWEQGHAPAFELGNLLEAYRSTLPFALTGAQERVLGDILRDIQRPTPMARLLQGDVGSGKTAVAAAALAAAVANGYQGALMAPTEILAEQHYRTLSSLLRLQLNGRLLRVELLTGSLSAAKKREVAEAVASGAVDVAVGTHALIQDGVSFKKLGLAVVDEQHRFGVMQRAALRERIVENVDERPVTPHLLVMSATPIPRTLALTFFGDLDVSVIDEMPPGRLPVKTSWSPPDERGAAYAFVREQVRQGRQAFVVCPLIDESAAIQSRAATLEYERLSTEVFPDLRLGLLHGRMPQAEKEAVLQSFRRGELHILVATTVIEVGIDIPNASVMVIEGADRFGLAQMHQLRGRVGRGADQSFCLLLSDDPSASAKNRLQLLEDLNDGFALAEADLRLRGPGDYFGTRQSGLPELQAADFSDAGLIESARQEAMTLLADDPTLQAPEHTALANAVARAKKVVTGDVS